MENNEKLHLIQHKKNEKLWMNSFLYLELVNDYEWE